MYFMLFYSFITYKRPTTLIYAKSTNGNNISDQPHLGNKTFENSLFLHTRSSILDSRVSKLERRAGRSSLEDGVETVNLQVSSTHVHVLYADLPSWFMKFPVYLDRNLCCCTTTSTHNKDFIESFIQIH